MSNARFFSAIGFTAIVTAFVMGSLTLSLPARADTPRTMVCAPGTGKGVGTAFALSVPAWSKAADAQIIWANEQMSAGRVNFAAVPLVGTTATMFCAW